MIGQTQPEGGKARVLYLQLREDILQGRYGDGTLLPGEQRLAADHAVSRVTVRRALEGLLGDGLIEKRPGSGTVVRTRNSQNALSGDFATLMPHLVELGERTEARLLSFSYETPVPRVADALGLSRGDRVQTAVRVRFVGDTPFSYLTTHVPEAIARGYSEAELATTPLFRLLERAGVTVADARQSVSAMLAGPEIAEALEVSVGSALLSIERVVRDDAGRGVEHLTALYRPDLFRLEMSLNRVGDGDGRHWAPVLSEAAE